MNMKYPQHPFIMSLYLSLCPSAGPVDRDEKPEHYKIIENNLYFENSRNGPHFKFFITIKNLKLNLTPDCIGKY